MRPKKAEVMEGTLNLRLPLSMCMAIDRKVKMGASGRSWRSVSDFAREAIARMLEGGQQADVLAERRAGEPRGLEGGVIVAWGFGDRDYANGMVPQLRRMGGLLNQEVRAMNTILKKDSGLSEKDVSRFRTAIENAERTETEINETIDAIRSYFDDLAALLEDHK